MPGPANAANTTLRLIEDPVAYFTGKEGTGYECYWIAPKDLDRFTFIGTYEGKADKVMSEGQWQSYAYRMALTDDMAAKSDTLVFGQGYTSLSLFNTKSEKYTMHIYVSNCSTAPKPPPIPNRPGFFSIFSKFPFPVKKLWSGGKKSRKHKKRAKKSSKRKTRR